MRLVAIAAVVASLAGVAQALAQTSLSPPRPAERDLQEMNSLMTQRAQDALRQQQQSFDSNQKGFEGERQKAIPVLPSDPSYRGTMFR
jgi:hypothetical protein